MIFELGSVRIATGRHASTPPPVVGLSPDAIEKAVDQTLEKRLPPGAYPARDLSIEAARIAGGAAATGPPPDPGPLPTPRPSEIGPLRWNFQQNYNSIPQTGRGKIAPFVILRQLAKISDIIRICIETRKDQISSLAWDLVPKDKTLKGNAALQKKIAEKRAFFRKPDGRRSFQRWVRHAIEEILVIDALSIYLQPTRGGQLHSLRIIDGATIVPLLDRQGETPAPPSIAYRQIINGQPVAGGDCTSDQLLYLPRTVTESPYGLSPTEAVLLTVNAALNRSVFNLAYYSEGNIPRALAEAPETWTPEQIKEFQVYFDELVSGAGSRSRIKMIGSGMAEHIHEFATPDFKTDWDEWLMKVTCAAFGVPPAEIGFTEDVNKSSGDSQENVAYRRGVKPLTLFLKEIFDDVLETGLDAPELEFAFIGGEVEDKKLQADVDAIYLARGVISVDDVRSRMGMETIGLGPTIDTQLGPIPVEQLLVEPPDDDPDTSEVENPAAAAPGSADLEEQAQKHLRTWKNVAIKRLKLGRSPERFVSEALPADVKASIQIGLLKAKTPGDIVAVFERYRDRPVWPVEDVTKAHGAAENRQFIGAPRVALARLRKHFSKQFKAQGRDLGAHLEDAIVGAGE